MIIILGWPYRNGEITATWNHRCLQFVVLIVKVGMVLIFGVGDTVTVIIVILGVNSAVVVVINIICNLNYFLKYIP